MKCAACKYDDDPEGKYAEQPWRLESQFVDIAGNYTTRKHEYSDALSQVWLMACPQCSTVRAVFDCN